MCIRDSFNTSQGVVYRFGGAVLPAAFIQTPGVTTPGTPDVELYCAILPVTRKDNKLI